MTGAEAKIKTIDLKSAVKAHWQGQPCGTRGVLGADRAAFFARIEEERYTLEPYLHSFARFEEGQGKKVLEIGVGAGTDFINWVRSGAEATGIDLTEQSVELTKERLQLEGLRADVKVGDAENLPFNNEAFDLVYSYGVLHHSPDTAQAISEVYRVLRPAGRARIMIYHTPSWVGLMLWSFHCLGKFKPWKTPRWAVYNYLESPGTKAYTVSEARELFSCFSQVEIRTQLTHGDLLLMRPNRNYSRWYHQLVWKMYPRWAIKLTGHGLGTAMFVEAIK